MQGAKPTRLTGQAHLGAILQHRTPEGPGIRTRSKINALGINVAGGAGRAAEEPYIASMGIYVAKASAIRDLLMKHYPQARSSMPARLSASARQHTGFVETLGIVDRCLLSCRPDCCCRVMTLLRGPNCWLMTLPEAVW